MKRKLNIVEIAYVLIRIFPGHERKVHYKLRSLRGINGVSEAHPARSGMPQTALTRGMERVLPESYQ